MFFTTEDFIRRSNILHNINEFRNNNYSIQILNLFNFTSLSKYCIRRNSMNNFIVKETPIKDLVIIEPKVFGDERGFFALSLAL